MSSLLGGKQRLPIERLVRLVAALHQAGRHGLPMMNLIEIGGFDAERGADQLLRDLRHLRAVGWQIENIGGEGNTGIYRMVTVDNRIAVRLNPDQQAALRRAVLLASRADLVERLGLPAGDQPDEFVAAVPVVGDSALSVVTEALRSGCVLRFRYSGTERLVHPEAVRNQNGKWYLRGHEDGSEVVKAFVVSRMTDVVPDPTIRAVRLETGRHTGLHPMTWEVDEPVEVRLLARTVFAADVRRWLGDPVQEHSDGEMIEFTYLVTHRSAFRARIYELGQRVRVLGPDDVRAEILDELAVMAGE